MYLFQKTKICYTISFQINQFTLQTHEQVVHGSALTRLKRPKNCRMCHRLGPENMQHHQPEKEPKISNHIDKITLGHLGCGVVKYLKETQIYNLRYNISKKVLFHNFIKSPVIILLPILKPHNPSNNIGHNGQHYPFGTLYITFFEKKMWNVYVQAGGQSMKNEKIRYRDLYSASIPYPTNHLKRLE